MPFCSSVNVSSVESALSAARLGSYQSLVVGATPRAVVGAYLWGLELNTAFSPVLSMVEVVLRNSVHRAASAMVGKPDWYSDVLKSSGDEEWKRKVARNPALATDFYRKGVPPHHKKSRTTNGRKVTLRHWRSQAEGSFEEITSRLAKANVQQAPDQIVAHAMFGFWLHLLGPSFEAAASPLALWPSCTAQVFGGDPTMTRSRAHALLVDIKGLRNRVSHQEPAWRLGRPLTPAGVHATLSTRVSDMRQLLRAMEPAVDRLLENAGTFDRLRWLLDPATIATYAGATKPGAVDMRKLSRTVRKFAERASRTVGVANPIVTHAVTVQHAGKTMMAIVPNY